MVDGVHGHLFQVVQLRVEVAQYQEPVFATVRHLVVTGTLAGDVIRIHSRATNNHAQVSENAYCLV